MVRTFHRVHKGRLTGYSCNGTYLSVGMGMQTDVRAAQQQVLSWSMAADLEALAWAPMAPTTFLASSEDGLVAAFDARSGSGSAPLYRLSAHDQPTCALSFCPGVPGLLCTASTDGLVRPCLPALCGARLCKCQACVGLLIGLTVPWHLACPLPNTCARAVQCPAAVLLEELDIGGQQTSCFSGISIGRMSQTR